MRKIIPVTKPFLPPKEEYQALLNGIWDRNWLTNNGPLSVQLEEKLKNNLKVKNLLFVSNGTVALQLAIKALNLTGEIITTPFSYVATTSAILWEDCSPVFVDIDNNNFCIDPLKIEAAITEKTEAILATHVFGHPCDVFAIDQIAKEYNLKVIYDGAHVFGTEVNGKSILSYGDISICSFHATKLFHTIEGGAIITNDKNLAALLKLKRQFGHEGDKHYAVGINGKNSEFHAAMGLCNLNHVNEILTNRKRQWLFYNERFVILKNIQRLFISKDFRYNYAYFPIILSDEQQLQKVLKVLDGKGIYPRRYFYPALNRLPYLDSTKPCPVAETIAPRVLCLPLFHELKEREQEFIFNLIYEELA